MLQNFLLTLEEHLDELHIPTVRWTDVVEILLIAFVLYHIMVWFRKTRAWSLFRGLTVILMFMILAYFLDMSTIKWLAKNVTGIAVIAAIVILQPELRNALEQLGQRNFLGAIIPVGNHADARFSDHTVDELVRAAVEMAKVRTGALIVIEQTTSLHDIERSGIEVDAAVSSQLLINIFEKNTPLHDGAVIIRGDRVASATCYLPLSDNNQLGKELGTRHRAGIGISEVSDSLSIIVSEETGQISVAQRGELERGLDAETLRARLKDLQHPDEVKAQRRLTRRSRVRNAVKTGLKEGIQAVEEDLSEAGVNVDPKDKTKKKEEVHEYE